ERVTAAACIRRLAHSSRPRGERECHLEWDRQMWLLQQHCPGLQQRSALTRGIGEEPVLRPLGLRRVESANDANRGVRHDSPLNLASRLLSADEDHAEAPTALRDV